MKKEYIELFRRAQDARSGAYAPYSDFFVGAALLMENEAGETRVFTGANVENASFGATICAERAACVKAVHAGFRKVKLIAVASSRGEAPMCGICRQFLSEFTEDADVITGATEEDLHVAPLSQLLPSGFRLAQEGK